MSLGVRSGFLAIAVATLAACAPAATPPPPTPAPPTAAPAAPATKPPAATTGPAAAAPAATKPPAAPAPTATPAPTVNITMGYSNITGDEIAAFYALDKGIFTKHNLKVDGQLIAGGAQTTAALLANGIQIAHAGGSESLSATANGADLVVVATLAGYYPYLFEAIPEIQTPQDVVGKKLGVSNLGGSADIATRTWLRQNGVDPEKDVTIIPTGSAQNRAAALQSGAIQAGMAAPPDSLAVEAVGLRPIADLAALHVPSANTAVVMQRSWANQNKEVVQRYVDALVEASVALKKDKPGAVTVLKNYFQSDDEHAMEVAYDFYANEVVQPLPFPKPEQLKDSVEVLSATNPKIREVDVAKLLDPSFVQSAADRGVDKQ